MDADIPAGNVVVVVDVIRAFTTAAVAFERGVREIACAPSLDVGRDLRRLYPDRLLVGESKGLKPVDYDFGNSPFEMSRARLDGRRLIQSTSNGTVGLARCLDPAALLAVSAVNVGATARHGGSRRTTLGLRGRSSAPGEPRRTGPAPGT
ncbi:hypothetical protein DMB66_26450 [Actinoplanes sp. ATCC 53533]|uniref:2-phosphosulfolactate phosphatase n=1 Tax=Actinoplanes sp. ATCC 53533 TaxID=1288362 RepID=UPI000F7791F5|nr:2-phosphosulfolactate phosphatase [Actinoplanes sp. ATCC 53533]RSM59794.1 hypothetical protein DMB66_26450 [Actinoplanes sp. ATCC 53533]